MATLPRRPPRDDLAPTIVKEAETLFAERGFEATTMQEIASRVGITAPGLYYYFPSKQSLLFEVLHTALASLVAREESAVEAARLAGVTAQLRAFGYAHVTFQIDEPEETAVYGSTFYGSKQMVNALTAEQRARLKDLQDRSLNLLKGILRQGVEAGEFRIPDLTATAFAILGIGEYVPAWFKRNGRLSSSDLGRLYSDLAVRIAGGEEPAPPERPTP